MIAILLLALACAVAQNTTTTPALSNSTSTPPETTLSTLATTLTPTTTPTTTFTTTPTTTATPCSSYSSCSFCRTNTNCGWCTRPDSQSGSCVARTSSCSTSGPGYWYASGTGSCPEICEIFSMVSCAGCQTLPGCGWCGTYLDSGTCSPGTTLAAYSAYASLTLCSSGMPEFWWTSTCPASLAGSGGSSSGSETGSGVSSASTGVLNPFGSAFSTTSCTSSTCNEAAVVAILVLATAGVCLFLVLLPYIKQSRNTAFAGSGGLMSTPGLTGFDLFQKRIFWVLLAISFAAMLFVTIGGGTKTWYQSETLRVYTSPYWFDNSVRCFALSDKCNFCNPANWKYLSSQGTEICIGVFGAAIFVSLAIAGAIVGVVLLCVVMFTTAFANKSRRHAFLAVFIPHCTAMLCSIVAFALWAHRVHDNYSVALEYGPAFGLFVTGFCMLALFCIGVFLAFRKSLGTGTGHVGSSSGSSAGRSTEYFDPAPRNTIPEPMYGNVSREPAFMMTNPVFSKKTTIA